MNLDLAAVFADPPVVHEAPGGIWRTHDDCYAYLAEQCEPGMVTMETGLGISTVLFAMAGTFHKCVVESTHEIDTLTRYLDERGIGRSRLSFAPGRSEEVLPRTTVDDLGLLFIDGCHGFPHTAIDWFYGARWLREGGVLVFDDVQIPAVAHTIDWFLGLDPRWESLRHNDRWAAYRRLTPAGSLSEEWTEQLFLGIPADAGVPA